MIVTNLKGIGQICCLFIIGNIFFCCTNPKAKETNVINYNSEKKFEKFGISKSKYNLKINYSGIGIFTSIKDTLVLVDELYKQVYFLDTIGNKINQFDFFKSKDSKLFSQSIAFKKWNNKYILINGRRVSYFNNKMEFDTTIYIKFKRNGVFNEVLEKPNPRSMDIYEINERNKSSLVTDNFILLNLESEHPYFNPYTSLFYYNNSSIFGKFSIEENRIYNSGITFSNVYKKDCCLPTSDGSFITTFSNKSYLLQFEADSNIYILNKNLNYIGKFGISNELNIKTNKTTSLDIAFDQSLYKKTKQNLSLFSNVFYNDQKEIVYRIFSDYFNSKCYLQVYKSYDLISQSEIYFGFDYVSSFKNLIFGIKNDTLCVIRVQ